MKETVLGKYYVEILTIAVSSEHAISMLQWRKPQKNGAAGDFAGVVERALQHRLPATSTLSIGELDRLLAELNSAVGQDKKKDVLRRLLSRTTARQQNWIVRIILRELKLGVSEKTLLK
jgi:DNA ligase-4